MSLVGNDVVALFPNIKAKATGKIVREEVERSPLKIDGFNYRLGTKYILMNKQYTGDLKCIAKFLPWRKKVKGTTPGIKSKGINTRKDIGDADDKQW